MKPLSPSKKCAICVSLLALSCTASADILSETIKQSEEKRMERLRYTKSLGEIKPFETDGCSGGLSAGWEYFADSFPGFTANFGKNPPWEQCCIKHDLAYWQGETKAGYEARLAADTELRSCVENTGLEVRHKPQQEISLSLKITANLMYQAVRLGGKPCTSLPWRWGYGWSACVNKKTPEKQSNEK